LKCVSGKLDEKRVRVHARSTPDRLAVRAQPGWRLVGAAGRYTAHVEDTMTQRLEHETLPDGSERMTVGDAAFEFARPRANVLVVTITGYDKGQFGTAPLDEIGSVLRVAAPVQLFVDARNAVGATVRVSQDWTSFFSRHQRELAHVHVLAGSKMVELTVAIARHLSRTGNLIQIYSDPGIFEAQIAAACKRDRKAPQR
jgi:hypothetical protein